MCGSLAFIKGLQGQQWKIALWLLIYTACQTFAKPKTAAEKKALGQRFLPLSASTYGFLLVRISIRKGVPRNLNASRKRPSK